MGMFDNTFNVGDIPMESASGYGNTNLFAIGAMQAAQGLSTNIAKLAGFQTEEDLLLEIYDNADFSTPEGRQAAVEAVMKINPTEGNKLQKQLSEAATGEAATLNTQIATENAQLARVKAMYTPTLQINFQRDQGPNGQHQAIANFLRDNAIETRPEELLKITTTAQAAALINSRIEKGASEWVKNMYKYVGDMQTAYIKRGVYEIAGLSDTGVYTEEVSQTLTQPDLIDPPEVDDQKFYKEGDKYNANDSQFTTAWKKIGGSLELLNGLAEVQGKLFTLQLEFLQKKDKKDYEDAEDAVNQWIGGISWSAKMTAPAYKWFKSHKPIHFKEFQKNPVAYYKKHRKEIESASYYAGGSMWLERQDNTDLFANIPFNLDEE